MKELIEFIATSLVDDRESVSVNVTEEGDSTVLELRVAKDDLGKVIGKQGRTARAMRALLSAAAGRSGARARLEILD
ncbi:MAG: KH domain-containing protein [Proteobacteria bacterium]|nr:KH domain-containing protein [Pseudomonadota bacterium]MBU1737352.1 KH domain-containing protein [Pseudomonadota bacterium]